MGSPLSSGTWTSLHQRTYFSAPLLSPAIRRGFIRSSIHSSMVPCLRLLGEIPTSSILSHLTRQSSKTKPTPSIGSPVDFAYKLSRDDAGLIFCAAVFPMFISRAPSVEHLGPPRSTDQGTCPPLRVLPQQPTRHDPIPELPTTGREIHPFHFLKSLLGDLGELLRGRNGLGSVYNSSIRR